MTSILLIEDDANLRRALYRMINRMFSGSALIYEAGTSHEAIRHIEENVYPHVIVSDFNLADNTNGGQVLAWIKTNRPELSERFIFHTTDDAALQLHQRFVRKPCEPDELRRAIRVVLDQQHDRSQ